MQVRGEDGSGGQLAVEIMGTPGYLAKWAAICLATGGAGVLFSLWLPQSGEEVHDRPCMEIYRNSPLDTPPAELLTDLCLPLRRAPEA